MSIVIINWQGITLQHKHIFARVKIGPAKIEIKLTIFHKKIRIDITIKDRLHMYNTMCWVWWQLNLLLYLWLILACSCDVSSSARSVTSLSESDSDGTYFLSKDEYLPDDVRNLRLVSIHASPASYTKQTELIKTWW